MAKGTKIRGITIEIGGDTSKLQKSLTTINRELKQNQAQLRDIDKLLKLDPTNTELLSQKYKNLEQSIDASKTKLRDLKEIQEQMAAGGKVGTPEFDALQREIIDTEQNLKSLEKEFKNFGSVAAQQAAAVGNKMKEIGNSMTNMGKDMTMKVTAPIVAGFGACVKSSMTFDEQMSKVKAISGANAEEFAALRDEASEMGKTTKFTATEAAEAFEYMAMAGWETQEMLDGIEGVLNLAAASGEDLATTSDIVTDALTAFGLEADKTKDFANILAATAASANTNVSMMGESFKYVAPLAGSLKYEARDVALALGLMANSGIKADQAGTSLRNLLQRMANPTKDSEMAMERLGIKLADDEGKMYSLREIMEQLRGEFAQINMPIAEYDARVAELDEALEEGTLTQKKYDAALEELNLQAFGAEGAEKARTAAMLAGARALSGILAITNATEEDYNDLAYAIDHASDTMVKTADGSVKPLTEALAAGEEVIQEYSGAAEAMSKTMMDNASGDWEILKSEVDGLAREVGDLLMPTIRELLKGLQQVITWLSELDPETQKTIVGIGLVVAAIGPLLLILGPLTTGFGALLTLAPKIVTGFGMIGGAFSKVGGAIGGLVGKITGGAASAASSVGKLGTAAAGASGPVSSASSSIGALSQNALGFVALGAGILLAAGGVALLAQSAIALANAGPEASVALLALIGTLALLAAGAAALAAPLTAGAAGLIAFGGAIALVGLGVLEACTGMERLSAALPNIVEYGADASTVILQLSVALGALAIGTGSAAVGAGALTIAAGALTIALAALSLGTGAMAVSAGVLTIAIIALTIAVTALGVAMTVMNAASGDALDKLGGAFKATFDTITKIVGGAVEWLKGIFNFEWHLPKISLPHFSIDGEFSLNPPSIPKISVDWYKKAMDNGMILNSPTIFGMSGGRLLGAGEAGPEAIVGVDSLQSMITNAVAGASGGDVTIPVYIGTKELDTIVVSAAQRENYKSGGR